MTSLCIFIGCWPWSIKGHTEMTSYHDRGLVFLLSSPQNRSINHLKCCCRKQIDAIFPCLCTVIDHRKRHNVVLTSSCVVLFVLHTLWRHMWSITVHTHGENIIYLLNRVAFITSIKLRSRKHYKCAWTTTS